MKYIDAEKLAKAIEDKSLDCSFALKMERLDTLALIDELQQEQQEVDFEIGKYMTTNLLNKRNHSTGIFHLTQKDYATIARHFYELGKNSK